VNVIVRDVNVIVENVEFIAENDDVIVFGINILDFDVIVLVRNDDVILREVDVIELGVNVIERLEALDTITTRGDEWRVTGPAIAYLRPEKFDECEPHFLAFLSASVWQFRPWPRTRPWRLSPP
jgi:hypothetical protein